MASVSTVALLLLGFAVFVVYLFALGISPVRLAAIASHANPYLVVLALIFDINFILFYGLAWFFLIKIVCPRIKLRHALLMVIIGWFGDMVVPAAFITGDAIRLYLVKRLYGVDMSKSAATVVVHRLLSAMAFAFFVTMGLTMFTLSGRTVSAQVVEQAAFVAGLATFAVAFGIVVISRVDFVESLGLKLFAVAERTLARFGVHRYRDVIEGFLKSFVSSMNLVKQRKHYVILSLVFLITQWFFGVSIPYTFFLAVGYPISFWAMAMAFPIYGVVDNIPVGIPANVGVLDVAMTSTFILLGAPRDVAAAVTILTRSVLVLFEAVLTGTITMLALPRIVDVKLSMSQFIERVREYSEAYAKED